MPIQRRFLCLIALAGCSRGVAPPATVDLPHTPARTQSLGNCWNFATTAWVESLALQAGMEAPDFSETYLTYRHFQEQLETMSARTPSSARRLDPSGSFATARSLIHRFGLVREGDFVSNLHPQDRVETSAFATLTQSLSGGELQRLFAADLSRGDRDALIAAELDRAFGVTMESIAPHAIAAERVPVRGGSLAQEFPRWQQVEFPLNLDDVPSRSTPLPYRARLNAEQERILRRVMVSLNRHDPVLVAWLVDPRALGANGDFSASRLGADAGNEFQGLHLTVAQDYLASGLDPASGGAFRTGEGEVSAELRDLAATHGKMDALVVKNSWGARGTWSRGGETGFTFLNADYLFSWVPRLTPEGVTNDLVLRGFVLPADSAMQSR